MFGYIKPNRPELLVKEDAVYKSVYCALCKCMGREYGALSRFTLNYDCTFLAIIETGLTVNENSLCFERKRCTTNPFKKCGYMCSAETQLQFAAAVSEILTYYKIKDDIEDSRFFKRFISRAALLFYSRKRKKAAKKYDKVDSIIEYAIKYQKETEESEDFILDKCAEPTALMLSKLFYLNFEEPEKRILEEMGYHIGRWVYFIDAADDIEKDLSEGSFNPFIKEFKITKETYKAEKEKINIKCNEVLNFSLSQALRAMELLSFKSFGTIAENIVAKGLPEMQRKILFAENKEGYEK